LVRVAAAAEAGKPRAPSRRRSERTAHTETAGNTADEELAFILNGNTADLEEFKSQGGKLILTNGFADPRSPTLNTVAYYERSIGSQTRDSRGRRRRAKRSSAAHAGIRAAVPVERAGAVKAIAVFDSGKPVDVVFSDVSLAAVRDGLMLAR